MTAPSSARSSPGCALTEVQDGVDHGVLAWTMTQRGRVVSVGSNLVHLRCPDLRLVMSSQGATHGLRCGLKSMAVQKSIRRPKRHCESE